MHAPADPEPGAGLWALPGIDQALRALYRDERQLSYLEIAEQLSTQFDCTISRNSVAGRVSRLQLPKRRTLGQHPRPAGAPKTPKTPKPMSLLEAPVMTIEPAIVPLEPDLPPGPLTVPGLEWRHCRWPIAGERELTEFCGKNRFGYSPYCPHHHGLAYTSPRVKWS